MKQGYSNNRSVRQRSVVDRTIRDSAARDMRSKGHRKKQMQRGGKIPLLVLMVVMLFFSALLVSQLYQIQIVEHEVNAQQAARQHFTKVTEQPERGSIYDRNGVELAGTTYVYRIGITPSDVRSITKNISQKEIAEAIALSLHLETDSVLEDLAKTDERYVQLKKDVPRDEADALREWLSKNDIGGVRIDSEPRRYYTNGSLASQVIGFANFDNGNLTGQLGVELQYNDLLTGQPGYKYVETDNYSGRGSLPFSVPTSLGAKNGNNVHLSIDINIQKIVQEELERAINLNDVTSGGSAVAMDPYTGEILAMASYPYFDSSDPVTIAENTRLDALNNISASDSEIIEFLSSEIWRNRAISDTYEPGSTMKAITAAIAFEEALSNESELFDDSPMQVLDWTISCHTKVGHGIETLEQGFWRSCNPVFAQLAQRTGVNKFYNYMQAFGFKNITGIDLPAEGTGILHTQPTELDMVTLSYGESSTLTPLQLVNSFCTFANGGNLIQPTVLKSVTDSEGAIVRETQPETIRKVISEETSARVMELLKGVVLYGTGSAAYIEGYSVAGKTSTSTDDFGDHTISFAGLAPAENPEIVVLVVLQKPRDRSLSSSGSAKACGTIIERSLEYMGVSREYSEMDISRLGELKPVPDIVGMTYNEAMRALSDVGLRAEAGVLSMGGQTIIKSQWPQAGSQVHLRSQIYLYPDENVPDDLVVIPDFTGKTVHESMLSATEAGLNILIDGECLGVVIEQNPLPTHGNTNNQANNQEDEAENAENGEVEEVDNDNQETGDSNSQSSMIDPETGNPVRPVTNRLQKGSQVRLRFEPMEECVGDNCDNPDHNHNVENLSVEPPDNLDSNAGE